MKYAITFVLFLVISGLGVEWAIDQGDQQIAVLRDSVTMLQHVIETKDSIIRDKDSVLNQMQTPYPYEMGDGRQRVIFIDSVIVDSLFWKDSLYKEQPKKPKREAHISKEEWEKCGGKWDIVAGEGVTVKKYKDKIIISANETHRFNGINDATLPTLDAWHYEIEDAVDTNDHRELILIGDLAETRKVLQSLDTVYYLMQGKDTLIIRRDSDPWPWDDLHMVHPKPKWDSLMKVRDTGQYKFIPYEYKK